jgi:hypothetical protein
VTTVDMLKTRKAAAAKAFWLQQEISEGGTPLAGELDFLLDYADPTEHLSTDEQELLRLAYLALQNDYITDGPLEFPDDAERTQLAKQMLE